MPYRVLLIEDDPDIQLMVRMSLRYQGDHEVSVASSGPEGLVRAAAESPDVILLDIAMPEMDGYETCRLLKADPRTSATPVIFLSARAQQWEIAKGLGMGAIGYLVKPFDPMTLHAEIAVILRSQQ